MRPAMMIGCCAGLLLLFTIVPVADLAEANWTPPLQIDEADRANSPLVLVEPEGDAIVQWLDDSGALDAQRYDVDTGWGPFDLLERSDVNPGSYEQFIFGIDLSGNIFAAWREWDGKRWWIHTSRFTAGVGWSDPEIIDTGDKGDSSDPEFIMNPAGNAIMMWRETTKQAVYTYTRIYAPGTGWGSSMRLPEDITTWYEPAISANGNAIYLYKTDDTGLIYARPYEAGSGWGVDQQIDMNTGTADGAVVGMDASGNATVVWSEDDGAQRKTYARRFEVGTGWGSEQGFVQGDHVTRIAMDPVGNVIMAWTVDGAYGVEADKIYTNTYEVGVGWGAPQTMWTAPDATGSHAITSFEVNSDGEAVALWCRFENSTIGVNIYANYHSLDTGWGTAGIIGNELDTWEHGSSWTGRAVIDEWGNVIAMWRYYYFDLDYPDERIYARRYEPGEGWATAQTIVAYSPWYRLGRYDIFRKPVISMNPGGDAFLVWIRAGMVVGMEHMYSINVARYIAERPPVCEGDFTPDGDVDDDDLAVFAADFGRSDCDIGPACEGDFEPDNSVDGKDLATFVADFGRTDCP